MLGIHDIAPLYEATSSRKALRYGTRCKGSHSATCTPTRLSTNDMNHASTFPAEASPHFTEPGVDLVGWLHVYV